MTLKPCPICGGPSAIVDRRINGATYYRVVCTNEPDHSYNMYYMREETAIKEWNTWTWPWRHVQKELPTPFVSVLGYDKTAAPLPNVHECYIDDEGIWHSVYGELGGPFSVTYWMEMPQCNLED